MIPGVSEKNSRVNKAASAQLMEDSGLFARNTLKERLAAARKKSEGERRFVHRMKTMGFMPENFMKRYLITFLFTLLLVSGLTVFAADTVEPAGPDLTITASTTEAAVGDEITFTVTMGPVDDLLSLQMRISLPEGLTCTGSELAEDLQGTLQFDSLEWDDSSLTLSGDGGHYTDGNDTELFTFQCEADGSFLGDVSVSLANLEIYCGYSENDRSYEVTYATNVFPAEVEITDNENVPTTENFILDTGTTRKIHTVSAENGETDITYAFTSSDPAVVSVGEDGTVTAQAEGTASVTAAGSDGSEIVYNVTVPHQHTFGEWEIVTEATETGPGLQTRTCTVCGSTEAQVIPQLEAAGDVDDQSDSDTGSGGFLHSPWLEVVIVVVIVVVVVIILAIYTRHKNRKS